jgi:hypothetical protein
MSYIGRDIRTGAFRQLDDISSGFDGSDTTHTMQVNSTNVSVGDVNQILLSLGGVIQKPGTDFTVSGSTLTFTTAPASGLSFFAILLGSDNGGTVTPTDGSVTGDKLASTVTTTSNITTTGTTSLDGAVTINDSSADVDFRVETNGNANMFLVDGGNDAVIFNGSTSNFASGSQAVQVYNSGVSFTSGYGIQGGANTDRASINLTSGSDGNVLFKVNNSEVARFTSGGLAIGGTGSANTLDDYEEGTWTPSGANLGVATNHKAIYRKIGDIVILYCDITMDSSPSDTAQATSLAGFPFTCNDDYFQCNSKVAGLNQTIEANIAGTGAVFRDKADGVICTRGEFAGDRCQHIFIYTTA